jgi:hypothetical protein
VPGDCWSVLILDLITINQQDLFFIPHITLLHGRALHRRRNFLANSCLLIHTSLYSSGASQSHCSQYYGKPG